MFFINGSPRDSLKLLLNGSPEVGNKNGAKKSQTLDDD
jgi:hypothetical protein